ncbi:MAG: helix-turn-helix transcriptional regulator [Verrucomicrobiota bacterium]
MLFGPLVRQLRIRQGLKLQEFCDRHGYACSNWSKYERGLIQPPVDETILRQWATQLGLTEGSEEWLRFFDYAAVDAGRLPAYLLGDEERKRRILEFLRELTPGTPSASGEEDLEVWHL